MITDTLANAPFYYGLGDRIKTALQFLEHADLEALECGKHEIDSNDIFIIVEEYNSKPIADGKWEAHRAYIDIQIVIRGTEKLGYLNIEQMEPTTEFDAEKDIIFGKGQGSFITAKANDFLIFTPSDAHMPGIAVVNPSPVKKAVVKIRV